MKVEWRQIIKLAGEVWRRRRPESLPHARLFS